MNKIILLLELLCLWFLIFEIQLIKCGGGGGSRYVNTGSYNGPKRKNVSIYEPLLDHVFEGYNPLALPICQSGKPLHLMIDMWLYQLFDLDEPMQELTTDVWIDLNWKDCSIYWDPKKYNGIEQITVPSHDVWHPDIFAYQSLHGNYEEGLWVFRESKVKITHDGTVQLGAQLLLRTFCRINISQFPYDSQECPITFSAWNKDLTVFNMTMKPKHEDSTGHSFSRASNGEWDVISLRSKNGVKSFHTGLTEEYQEQYSEVSFILKLTRKPRYIETYLIFPCVLLLWIAIIGFLLPVSSGEKIGMISTVLLSLVVFLLVVSENVPHTSDHVPEISKFFMACICMVTIGLFLTTIVLNVSHKSPTTKMPRCLQAFARSSFADFMCFKKIPKQVNKKQQRILLKSTSTQSEATEKMNENSIEEDNLENIEPKRNFHRDQLLESNIWVKLGQLLDRLSLLIYVCLCLILCMYIYFVPWNSQ